MSIDVENLVWLTSKSNLILEIVKNEERDNAIEVVEYVLGLLRSLPPEDDEVDEGAADDEPAAGGRTTPPLLTAGSIPTRVQLVEAGFPPSSLAPVLNPYRARVIGELAGKRLSSHELRRAIMQEDGELTRQQKNQLANAIAALKQKGTIERDEETQRWRLTGTS